MQSARASEPPPPAPYEADFTYPPAALLCTGSTIVAAGQDVAFLQRGKPALHGSLHQPVDVLSSATVDGKVIVAAAFARHVERLAQGKWTALAPPLGDGEDIRDVAFSRTGALLVLTRTALYTEVGAEWTRAPLGNVVGSYVVLASNDQLYVLGYVTGDREQPTVLLRTGTTLAPRSFTGIAHGAVFSGVWASARRPVLWTIAEDGVLRELDLVAGTSTPHRPRVGFLHAVAGVSTSQGDVVVMTGDVAAHFDGEKFHYPRGEAGPHACFDAAGHDVYTTDATSLKRIPVHHPWLATVAPSPELVLADDALRGAAPSHPIPVADASAGGPRSDVGDDDEHDAHGPAPSIRIGYGWGRFPREPKPDQAQLDVMVGLRFLGAKKDLLTPPQLYFWPEAGYSSGPDHYATLSASVHYGLPFVASAGPFAAGLLSGNGHPGVRSGLRGSVIGGLFQLELAHQWVATGGPGQHGFRVVGSIDLFAGTIAVILIGIPSAILTTVIIGLVR
ncbi:MAG: hypothetical protein JWM74_4358 [Myxococcaceae bacterium]|nr:hypothetical protein [Myxococcaceae bacterium]